jgi:[ribosomal protein S5]-alanine N-acetyltransferase
MSDDTLFETERLALGGWRHDQLDDLMRLHGDPVVAQYLKEHGQPWTREEAEESLNLWIELYAAQRLGKLRVRRKSDGVLVGRAGYGIYTPTGEPEIGYALYPEHWGNGYAFEAASGLRDWLFRETDWDHFIGMADVRNAPSLAILTGIGMTRTRVEANDHGQLCQFHIFHRPA